MASEPRKTPPSTTSERAGRFILAHAGPEPYYAFHPNPLPPDPPLEVDAELQELLDRGNQALGRLDGITLPRLWLTTSTLCPSGSSTKAP